MKVLLGCDVDPILPPRLANPCGDDIWGCLRLLDGLVESFGPRLPPITWLLRSDESVRFATGKFDSGFQVRPSFWRSMIDRGHEIGWHMHLASFKREQGHFGFDPQPPWLRAAHEALAAHAPVAATRTGWDFGSNHLMNQFESVGVRVDFSALPGNIVWPRAGTDTLKVDWLRCPDVPYHPATDDYQRPGQMRLLEIPIAQFQNQAAARLRRVAWRLRHGCLSIAGLRNRTKMLTEPWDALPRSPGPAWAFHFHPEDLAGHGLLHFVKNVKRLSAVAGLRFVTASMLADRTPQPPPQLN